MTVNQIIRPALRHNPLVPGPDRHGFDFRPDLQQVPADDRIAVAPVDAQPFGVDALNVEAAVEQDEPLAHPFQHAARLRLAFSQPPFGDDLRRGFPARAEKPGDRTRLVVPHRRVGEREMRLLRITMPVHHQQDVVHVDRHAGIGLRDDRGQFLTDLRPHVQQRLAEAARMFAAEDIDVAVVIQQRARCTPGEKHRLLGAQHHLQQRAQRHRPARRHPDRRGRPVVLADQRAHRATCPHEPQLQLLAHPRSDRQMARATPRSCLAASTADAPAAFLRFDRPFKAPAPRTDVRKSNGSTSIKAVTCQNPAPGVASRPARRSLERDNDSPAGPLCLLSSRQSQALQIDQHPRL